MNNDFKDFVTKIKQFVSGLDIKTICNGKVY